MAAAAVSAMRTPLGVSAGPDSTVLVDSTNVDVDSNIDFVVLGPCEGVEVQIISGAAKTGTPSVVFTLQRLDLASNTFVDLVATTALTDAGERHLLVSHHAGVVANVAAARLVTGGLRLKIDYTGTPTTDVLNGLTVTANAI